MASLAFNNRPFPWKNIAFAGMTAFLFAGCGGDDGSSANVPEKVVVVSSIYNLGDCTMSLDGDTVFVRDQKMDYICLDGEWNPVEESEIASSSSKNNVKDSTSFEENGTANKSSSSKENESEDKSSSSSFKEEKSSSSTKDKSSSSTDEIVTIKDKSISGLSQKGPFMKGATVTAYEIDDPKTLLQTGRTFNGTITKDNGSFNLSNVSLKTNYIRLSANGYYRNEVSGKTSMAPITLNALSDLSSRSSVNINLLTHLEYNRVAHLMGTDGGALSMKDAKKQAEKEVFDDLHIESTGFNSSEDLDVLGKTAGDAALLAISILLQGNRTESDLEGMLAAFGADLSDDGKWDDFELKAELADSAVSVDLGGKLANVRNNMKKWELSTTVPDFEKYYRLFWSGELGLGVCGSDSVPVGTVKNVTNSKSRYYAKNYTDTTSAGKRTRFICVDADSAKWRIATTIEMDTLGWGHDFKDGDVRNGQVDRLTTYVYQDNNWRYGTSLDSVFVNLGGKACIVNGDTSTVKYRDLYYVCDVDDDYGSWWAVAPDIYNDTYESRKDCMADGAFGNGKILVGRVNKNKKYVCDAGEFRIADSIEFKGDRGCTSYNRNELFVLAGQYSYYRCSEHGWEFTMDKLNNGIVKDSRDGKSYKTIGIKSQNWLAENLNFDYKVDGSSYGSVCNGDDCESFGRNYTYAAMVDSAGIYSKNGYGCGQSFNDCNMKRQMRGICPEGWHIPSYGEWESLFKTMEIVPFKNGANLMQAKGYEDWPNATDAWGFSAIPVNGESYFWNSEGSVQLDARTVYYYRMSSPYGLTDKYSLRCVQDYE